jgi:hypothetical protein
MALRWAAILRAAGLWAEYRHTGCRIWVVATMNRLPSATAAMVAGR